MSPSAPPWKSLATSKAHGRHPHGVFRTDGHRIGRPSLDPCGARCFSRLEGEEPVPCKPEPARELPSRIQPGLRCERGRDASVSFVPGICRFGAQREQAVGPEQPQGRIAPDADAVPVIPMGAFSFFSDRDPGKVADPIVDHTEDPRLDLLGHEAHPWQHIVANLLTGDVRGGQAQGRVRRRRGFGRPGRTGSWVRFT